MRRNDLWLLSPGSYSFNTDQVKCIFFIVLNDESQDVVVVCHNTYIFKKCLHYIYITLQDSSHFLEQDLHDTNFMKWSLYVNNFGDI